MSKFLKWAFLGPVLFVLWLLLMCAVVGVIVGTIDAIAA